MLKSGKFNQNDKLALSIDFTEDRHLDFGGLLL